MSILRTIEDFRYGVLLHTDIVNTIRRFLDIWKEKANGTVGINVPNFYNVVIDKIVDGEYIVFKLVYRYEITEKIPVHYDYDSDYFQEGFGYSNISHYESKVSYHNASNSIKVPISLLVKPSKDIELWIDNFVKEAREKEKQEKKQQEISELKDRLQKLEGR